MHSDTHYSDRPTYWLTRFVILRFLGAIYAVAFLVIINQSLPLFGSGGLLPAGTFLHQVKESFGYSAAGGFMHLPSVFWFSHSDASLLTAAWIGLALSVIALAGYTNALIMAVLWFIYMSFVHIGQDWYGYGWELQLLETGFLAIFLCPLTDMRPFPKTAPPKLILVLFRWLIFRVMFGAALIKLRGDEVWRSGTALYYHFETQPLPGPLSRWFHFLPRWVLQAGVWFNFLAELVAPWFVFWPRLGRHIAGVILVLFQVTLILSGNLSFFNWLTIVPALACFDDGFWERVLSRRIVRKAATAIARAEPSQKMEITSRIVAVGIALLSIRPVVNMLSADQVMNTSFDPLELVNTYGAFGTVGRERMNVVFEGTMNAVPNDSADWKQYLYKDLPVELHTKPPQIAPYQLRLDWQMWFAAMSTPENYPWTIHLVWKLLHNDGPVIGLFASNPFPGRPPRYIRAVLYRYRFAPAGNREGAWWIRERVGDYWLPPMSVSDPRLLETLKSYGWLP